MEAEKQRIKGKRMMKRLVKEKDDEGGRKAR